MEDYDSIHFVEKEWRRGTGPVVFVGHAILGGSQEAANRLIVTHKPQRSLFQQVRSRHPYIPPPLIEEERGQCIRNLRISSWNLFQNMFSGIVSSSTLSPLPVTNYSRQCVGGGRGISRVGDHILQDFYNPYVTRSEPTKLFVHPKTINLDGEGPQTDKQLPQSPFPGYFQDEEMLPWLLLNLSF